MNASARFLAWANQYKHFLLTASSKQAEYDLAIHVGSAKAILADMAREATRAGLDSTRLWEIVGAWGTFSPSKLEIQLDAAWTVAKQLQSMATDTRHPWLRIRDDYRQRFPKATARQVAAEIFSQMDGQEQSERLAEFELTHEYSGKNYPNAREAAIAKVKRSLERLE